MPHTSSPGSDQPADVTLRQGDADDLAFLMELLEVTLVPYIVATYGHWDEDAELERFERKARPDRHQIVELDGAPIGCVFVERMPETIKLNRILILPEHQRQGIGTRLVLDLMHGASRDGLPVTLRVMRVNPARTLYERLGFRVVDETDTHYLMVADAPD